MANSLDAELRVKWTQSCFGHDVLALVLFGLLGACSDEPDEPQSRSDAGAPDASIDAGLDAARDAGAPPLDAARLDATLLDAGTGDAGTCKTFGDNICHTGTPAISCGGATCSGATPYCCRVDNQPAEFYCIGVDEPCGADAGIQAMRWGVTLRCDNADECAPGERCVDYLRKGGGVGSSEGSRCEAACGPSPGIYPFQLCERDCECEPGASCVSRACTSFTHWFAPGPGFPAPP